MKSIKTKVIIALPKIAMGLATWVSFWAEFKRQVIIFGATPHGMI